MQVRQHVRNSLCEPPQVTSESQHHALLNMATGGLSSQGILVSASHVWRATVRVAVAHVFRGSRKNTQEVGLC